MRLLCLGTALPEGGEGDGRRRGQGFGGGGGPPHEGHADRDDAFGPGSIWPDGRKLQPAYLFEAKAPQESAGSWDYYKLLQTTSEERVSRPLAEGDCTLARS
jgi:hypothetical protein